MANLRQFAKSLLNKTNLDEKAINYFRNAPTNAANNFNPLLGQAIREMPRVQTNIGNFLQNIPQLPTYQTKLPLSPTPLPGIPLAPSIMTNKVNNFLISGARNLAIDYGQSLSRFGQGQFASKGNKLQDIGNALTFLPFGITVPRNSTINTVEMLAKNSKTYRDFLPKFAKLTPQVQKEVTRIFANPSININTLEDFYKTTKQGVSVQKVVEKANLRTKGTNLASNVREFDNPLWKGEKGMIDWRKNYKPEEWVSEPFPWETAVDDIPRFNKQEIDRAIIEGIQNAEGKRFWHSALSKVSPEIQEAVTTWDKATKAAQVKANKIAFYFKNDINPDLEYRLIKYSQKPNQQTAELLGLTTKQIDNAQDILSKNRAFNDEIFDRAKKAGINLRYLKNHILQAFLEKPEQIDEALKARGLGNKPGFANKRQIENFMQGEAIGFTPKYTTFSQLNAMAEHELQKALANKDLFQKLIDSKQILPSNTPGLPSYWKNVTAPFFPQAQRKIGDEVIITTYKAPEELANLLNNIFGTQEQGVAAKGIRLTGKASSVMQDVALSGGIGPLNFFGLAQFIKEATSGRIMKPAGAFLRSFSGTLSKNFEIKNADIIEEMASQGIDARGLTNYQTLYLNVKHSRGLRELIGQGWYKIINEKTFAGYMNQLQIEFFKDAKTRYIKKGIDEVEAGKLAGKATKVFYGLSNKIGRSREIDNAITTVFLAPKYRESLINIYKGIGLGILPHNWGKPEYAGVQRLAAGIAVSYGIYNLAQRELTGKYMWENPEGKEFELVIPVGDPKDKKYISFPLMPSFLTMPRKAIGAVTSLAKGNPREAVGQVGGMLSIPASRVGEIVANRDYFGQPIYGEGTTPMQTLAYGVGSFAPGYVKAGLNYATGKSTAAFAGIQALELPIRKGTYKSEYYSARDTELEKLSPEKRRLAEFMTLTNAQNGPDSMTEAKMQIADEELLNFKRNVQLASNPNDPLYSRPIEDIKLFLAYQATSDTDIKAQLRVIAPWIPEVQYQNSLSLYQSQQDRVNPTQGYDPNSLQGKMGTLLNPPKNVSTTNFIDQPTRNPMQQLTEEQVKIASTYTALPGTSSTNPQKRALLNQNPWLRTYWDANETYYAKNPYEISGPVGDYLTSIGIGKIEDGSFKFSYGKKPKKITIATIKAPKLKVINIKSKAPKIVKLKKYKSPVTIVRSTSSGITKKQYKVKQIKFATSKKPRLA